MNVTKLYERLAQIERAFMWRRSPASRTKRSSSTAASGTFGTEGG